MPAFESSESVGADAKTIKLKKNHSVDLPPDPKKKASVNSKKAKLTYKGKKTQMLPNQIGRISSKQWKPGNPNHIEYGN